MPMIRTPPSGPAIVGAANGDLLVWSSATNEWLASSETPYLNVTEFDYIISSRADLVAVAPPVGGDISLPSGSYFFKQAVLLNDGERVLVDAAKVLMMARPAAGLVGNYADDQPWFRIENGGEVLAYDVTFYAAAASRHGVLVDASSSFTAQDCEIRSSDTGAQAAIACSGSVLLQRCVIPAGIQPIAVSGGARLVMNDCRVTCTVQGFPMIDVDATAETVVQLTRCVLLQTYSAQGAIVRLEAGVDVPLWFTSNDNEYRWNVSDVRSVILAGASAGLSAIFSDDRFYGATGLGTIAINVAGLIGELRTNGCRFEGHNVAVVSDASAATHAEFNRNTVLTNTGLIWPAADLPANGLFEFENHFGAGTPFGGHASTDSGVVRRANIQSGTLLTETALTP